MGTAFGRVQASANEIVDATEKYEELVGREQKLMEQLEDGVSQLGDAALKAMESAEEKLGQVAQMAKKANEVVEAVKEREVNMTENTAGTRPVSYAEAATRRSAPPHKATLAQAKFRARHIIVDGIRLEQGDGDTLTEAVLRQKAEMAFALMQTQEVEVPAGAKVVSARILRNRGVEYEMDSAATVQWLGARQNKTAFLENLGSGGTTLKVTPYTAIAKYVPIAFDPEDPHSARLVETDSGLEEGSIQGFRWIKPVTARKMQQRNAFAFVKFNSAEAANFAIDNGLIIEGRKVEVKKQADEPLRCKRCQLYKGHVASACKSIHETCGTCGATERHDTAKCPVTDDRDFRCASCNVKGHASWQRQCPTFQRLCESRRQHNPASRYRYFPTENPETWEQIEMVDTELTRPPPQRQEERQERTAVDMQWRPGAINWAEDQERGEQWQDVGRDGSHNGRGQRDRDYQGRQDTHHQEDYGGEHPGAQLTTGHTGPNTMINGVVEVPVRSLRIWQQNLAKSLEAQDEFLADLDSDDYDLALLQEPYVDHARLTRLKLALAFNKMIVTEAWEALEVQSMDITAIWLATHAGPLYIFNVYNDQKHHNTLRVLAQATRKHGMSEQRRGRQSGHLLWAGDFNRHHSLWEDPRNQHLLSPTYVDAAQPLINLISAFNLTMLLPSSIPTLKARGTGNYTRPDNIIRKNLFH
ncbi:hypothetical protein EUX98_g9587 [Antrodiella citrinella]|uniref:RRM domain-containing protein n=1 Tax=Antrodiella citrinella TaxID=2447956 RepID=A0A4S4LQM0_9APHY|nr:hypothetical protein EUX98_g9587 [Antrodiella citrinella]